MNETIKQLLTRRSVVAKDMIEPGPSSDEIKTILEAAHRVPDHGKLGPWRFIILEGEARLALGSDIAKIFAEKNPDAVDKNIEIEKQRLTRAPLVICVISSPVEHKVPKWEQELSCGAVCMNLLHAANALGYASQWLTEWMCYDEDVDKLLNVNKHEKIAGFVYIGSKTEQPSERVRPSLEDRVTYWK